MKIKRVLTLVIAAGMTFSAVSQEPLTSILGWERSRPNWKNDKAEVTYIIMRCGAVISSLGSYLSANATRPEDKPTGDGLQLRGMTLSMIGIVLSQRVGMSQAAVERRAMALSESYSKLILENKALHNNVFAGFVYEDFQFCLAIEKEVKPK